MQISELMKNGKPSKGIKVKVRVPSRLVAKLGDKDLRGEFVGLEREGRRITVRVKLVGTSKSLGFRPQDVEVVA